jgi:hypothetical protein
MKEVSPGTDRTAECGVGECPGRLSVYTELPIPGGRPSAILEVDQMETGRAATPRFSVGDEDQANCSRSLGERRAQLGGVGHWAPALTSQPGGWPSSLRPRPLTVPTDTPRLVGFVRLAEVALAASALAEFRRGDATSGWRVSRGRDGNSVYRTGTFHPASKARQSRSIVLRPRARP